MNIVKRVNGIALIEDHHEALDIWRQKGFKNLTLVHIDAHIDFLPHRLKPLSKSLDQVIKKSSSITELKKAIEKNLVFSNHAEAFGRQTSVGNFIYAAMCEGIVKDFYWVIPGGPKEFKASHRNIDNILNNLKKNGLLKLKKVHRNYISALLMGNKFVVSTMENLPKMNNRVLLDIDTDFLVVDSLLHADATQMISKRSKCIEPQKLVFYIQKKIKSPAFTTIAYSTNGGYTPMKYRYLADEVAYCLAPEKFKHVYKRKAEASSCFDIFEASGNKQFYKKAARLEPAYRARDNNYGPLYLRLNRFDNAQEEFLKILKADSDNYYALLGLGNVYLKKKDYSRSGKFFKLSLKIKEDLPEAKVGLAKVKFALGKLKAAKMILRDKSLLRYCPDSYYFLLGEIYLQEKNFKESSLAYMNSINFGSSNTIGTMLKLLKIMKYLEDNSGIINFVKERYFFLEKKYAELKRTGKIREKEIHDFKRKFTKLQKLIKKEGWL